MSHSRRIAVALARLGSRCARRTRAASTRCGSTRRRARSPGTAARMHATCDSACQPQPITPSVAAPGAREVLRRDARSPRRCAAGRACRRRSRRRAPACRCGRAVTTKRAPVREARVHLRARVAELEVDGGHHRERAVLEPEPVARPVLDAAGAPCARKHASIAVDRVRRRQQRARRRPRRDGASRRPGSSPPPGLRCLTCDHLVTYHPGHGRRRPRLQGAGRSDAPATCSTGSSSATAARSRSSSPSSR